MLWDSIWTLLNNFDNFFSVLKRDKSFFPCPSYSCNRCNLIPTFFASCEFMFSKWFAILWKCNKLLFSFPRYLFSKLCFRNLLPFVCFAQNNWELSDFVFYIAMSDEGTYKFIKLKLFIIHIWSPSSSSSSSKVNLLVTMTLDLRALWQPKGSKWRVKMISRQRIWNKFQIFPRNWRESASVARNLNLRNTSFLSGMSLRCAEKAGFS